MTDQKHTKPDHAFCIAKTDSTTRQAVLAQRQGRLKEALRPAVSMYRLLIIDEIGCLPLSRDQANLLF